MRRCVVLGVVDGLGGTYHPPLLTSTVAGAARVTYERRMGHGAHRRLHLYFAVCRDASSAYVAGNSCGMGRWHAPWDPYVNSYRYFFEQSMI